MDIRRRMLFKKKASSSGGGGSTTGGSYTVNLNSQWEATTAVSNPDSTLYDGVYRSTSNYNVDNGVAIMYITIKDCSSFKMYIRSYAESNYDYVMVSQLDQTINGSTSYSNTTLVKAHTRGNQQSGTALSSYTLVEFTGISSGEHTITVVYKKDGSQHSGDDRGYVLIEKMQAGSGDSGGDDEGAINTDNYLTIEARENGLTASLSKNACEYCVDGDGNWKTLSAGTATESINSGQTLSFRGELTPITTGANQGIGTFTISKKCNLKGNCMSMLFGDNAVNNYSLSDKRSAFFKLFYNCTNIVNVSSGFLPATTLARNCYAYMFNGCTNLTTAPELPATTLADDCYCDMFYRCTRLTTAPELPATTLAYDCYGYMFYNCTSLTTAPELPATTLASSCYSYMFCGCSKLNYIKMLATDISASNCLSNWVYGVASTGTFVKNPDMNSLTTGQSGIPNGWTVVDDRDTYLTIEALEDGLTASLSTNACEYCVDGDGNWKSLAADTATESINTGHTLSFRGNLTPSSSKGIGTFTISKKCNLKGNCMSMLFGDNAANNYSLSGKNYAFYRLFYNCTSIVNVSESFLPATTLASNCYYNMFSSCSNLTTAPELPATTLTDNCYCSMFSNCKSLTAAPSLPATTLARTCYQYMFNYCTSLTTAPSLPATTLADSCYQYMFFGCKSLTTAPSLPATKMTTHCYGGMFQNCTNLTTAPELPATILSDYCYESMFSNCKSLTTVPSLPATKLAPYCYQTMFAQSSKLNYIKMLATDISASQCLYHWVNGVASSGTFVKNPVMTTLPTGTSGIPSGWTVVNDGEESGGIDNYLTIEAREDGLTASLSTNACEYCVDGDGNWKTLAAGTATESINSGQTLSFRGNLTPDSSNGIGTFTISKKCNLKGNCVSMLFGDNAVDNFSLSGKTYAFYKLFQNCTNIVNVSDNFLPATTLANDCYSNMFNDCTNLTTAPELPATTLASYCYSRMFNGCSSLTNAPELPATTLADRCYNSMFNGCSSLTNAPELPATTLAKNCYYWMFRGCTKLTTAPELPATTLANYCYYYMFGGCTKLNYIKMLATDISATNCLSNWVYGVASTGKFVKNSAMTSLTTGNSGIPSGWTVQNATS